uniref:Organic cation transporter-like protein isoform X2 n=2 Tax=Hirondellea gigas TaxID=1518452 RepID=A0A6A7FYT8_9CRUS
MQFEKILDEVGGFGLYQKVMCFSMIPFTTGLCGMVYYVQLIVLSVPDFRCAFPKTSTLSIPNAHTLSTTNSSTNAATVSSVYTGMSYNMSTGNDTEIFFHSTCHYPAEGADGAEIPCTDWVFDDVNMLPTLSTENLWVCENAWRPYTIMTMFWVGNVVGALSMGLVSDRFGRRPALLVCCLLYGTAGVASAFVSNFYAFLVLRMLVGSVHHTLPHLSFVIVLEFCSSSRRVVPLFVVTMIYTVASMLATVLAYSIWGWRTLVVITAAPALAIVFIYHWIPESASWQLTQGKIEEATTKLHHIASVNGKNLSRENISKIIAKATNNVELVSNKKDSEINNQHDDSSYTNTKLLSVLLTYPILRRRIIIVMIIWMLGCMCYYGHAQNTANMGKHLLLNYFLGAAAEIPSWATPFLIERFGRKPPLFAVFLLSGVAGIVYCGLVGVVNVSAVGLIGRLAVSAVYCITLQYGPEVFPTVVRGQGVAMAETLAGIAILLSPAIGYLEEYYNGLPLLVFGLLGCIAAGLTLLLPETKGISLPNTPEEAENITPSN